MSNFLDRLKNELLELKEKKDKLNEFIQSDSFLNISKNQRNLLKLQHLSMCTYCECLEQRLEFILSEEND
jgi:thioredoxin-related protein